MNKYRHILKKELVNENISAHTEKKVLVNKKKYLL